MSQSLENRGDLPSLFIRGLLKNSVEVLSTWYSSTLYTSVTENALYTSMTDNVPFRSGHPFRLHEQAESCGSSLAAGTASILIKRHCDADGVPSSTQLTDLPVGVLLYIASFLDARSLCRLGQTCHQLQSVAGDHLVWRRRLQVDSCRWDVLSHLSHPKVYEDASSDLSEQQIYASCYVNRLSLPVQSFTHPVAHKLRKLMRRLQGAFSRLLMFGSGLESVPLVKTMLWEPQSPYKPTGLFPGKDGVGSGVRICHKDTPINLVTLYTATKAERQAAASGSSGRVNKLVSPYSQGEQEDGAELTAAVQEQCQQANGFILVVNSSHLDSEAVAQDTAMLKAMLLSGSQQSALLVLCCQLEEEEEAGSGTLSPLEVADKLDLCSLNHPWQVRRVVLKTLSGLEDGVGWLLGASTV